jgi:hypothetical protein
VRYGHFSLEDIRGTVGLVTRTAEGKTELRRRFWKRHPDFAMFRAAQLHKVTALEVVNCKNFVEWIRGSGWNAGWGKLRISHGRLLLG